MASLTVDKLGCTQLQGLAGRRSYDHGSYRQRPMKIVAAATGHREKSNAGHRQESNAVHREKSSAGHREKSSGNSVAMETVAKRAPVTAARPVSHKDLPIENAQLPRALAAVDAEHPEGTVGRRHNDYTVLQQHCAFFDRNGDGIIFPQETYEGFKALGYPPFVSALAGLVINGAFSYPTYDDWFFDPRLPIYLDKIHRTKHGSDSEVYDTEGRFLPSKFEEIFNKYARTKPNAMTYPEIIRMTDCIRNVNDPFGWSAAKLEWGFTYWLVKDEEGFASKEAIRGIYDGSFFDWIEQEIRKGENKYHKEVELRRINPSNNR